MQNADIKKILFIHISLSHYHLPRLQNLSDHCKNLGIEFYNIELSSYLKAYSGFVTDRNINFNDINLFPEQLLENIPNNKIWSALQDKLEEIMPDVIFLYGYSDDSMRRAKQWAEKRKIATVLLSDSNAFDKKRYKVFELIKSLFVSRFDAAFVGGTSSEEYLRSLGIPSERIVYGFDVVDTEFLDKVVIENTKNPTQVRQKWGLPDNYFLFVGRLIPEKNIPNLLIAYEKYVSLLGQELSPWYLVICGSGPEEEKIKLLIQNLPEVARENICLHGYIKQPEIMDFFSFASCFVLPSVSESWGLVVNEAMACGVPVIVSNKSGCARDLVSENTNGWSFQPDDVDALVNLMIKITRMDKPARTALGICGKEQISKWGLARFSHGALESAQIAVNHQKMRK